MIKKILICLCFVFLLGCFSTTIKADDLDYIELYKIKIDPRLDGTLDMNFNIRWKVLDSKSEGPLEWIKIGIPNYHVDELTPISSNIKKMKYYIDSGSYIRIDFDRKYYAGDVLDIEFSSHQSYMYFLDNDLVRYDYNPGWFDSIIVENAIVLWNAKNVISSNSTKIENGYYKWQSRLDYGKTIKLNITYNSSSFTTLNSKEQFTSNYVTPKDMIRIVSIITLIVVLIIVFLYFANKNSDPYESHRGFYVGSSFHHGYHYHYYSPGVNKRGKKYVNNSGHIGGTGGSSCACACACAGGGRAGCSVKDFYHTNLNSEKVIENILEK